VPELFDSHSHFDDDSFDPDRQAAYARAQVVGVSRQIVPGISAALWPRLRRVCREYAGLYPAYGLHPCYLAEHRPAHLAQLRTWLEQEPAVAVGEIGLDYFIEDLDRAAQGEFFQAQLKLAREFDLPVILHARRSLDEVLKYLRRFPGLRGVVHSFVGSQEQAERLLALGFYLSFGGPLTYPRANRLRKLAQALPLERLLLETDAPDQPLVTHRGVRNEPAWLPEVLAVVAELRGQEASLIAAQTTRNTLQLFGIQA
jgi:TatD DNase family protein